MGKTSPWIVWEADRLGAHHLRQLSQGRSERGGSASLFCPYWLLLHSMGPCNFTCLTARAIHVETTYFSFNLSQYLSLLERQKHLPQGGKQTASCFVLFKTDRENSSFKRYSDWNVTESGFDILWVHEASNEKAGRTNMGINGEILSWHWDLCEGCAKSFCTEVQIPCLMTACLNLGLYDTLDLQQDAHWYQCGTDIKIKGINYPFVLW